MKRASLLALTMGVALSAQSTPKKSAKAPPEKPDTWERSKECAEQAEKVIVRIRTGMKEDSDLYPQTWENHYSPKYNRCFLETTHLSYKKADPDSWVSWMTLTDAFEQQEIATDAQFGKVTTCSIYDEDQPCEKVKAYISDHMRN